MKINMKEKKCEMCGREFSSEVYNDRFCAECENGIYGPEKDNPDNLEFHKKAK